MENIKVTVFCLAYNHEKYIRKALEGFVNQKTDFKYEVLIHDDASTDGTAQIIQEYEERYPEIIKAIYQKQNQHSQGVKITRTYLLPKSRGEFVAFCEGDDYWIDNSKLQKQYDVMTRNSSVLFCAHKVQCVNEDNSYNTRVIPDNRCGLQESCLLNQESFSDLLFIKGSYCFQTSSYFLRKDLYIKAENLASFFNGDQTLLYTALRYGDVYYLNEIMSNRRLMTIGNFHQRFLLWEEDRKIEHYLKKIRGNIFFDDLTEGKYRKKILYQNYLFLMSISLKYKKDKKIKQFFKDFRKKNKFNWKISFKLNMAYILYFICPIVLAKKLKV